VHIVVEWMVVLENLTSGRRRGESCACPGAAGVGASRLVIIRTPARGLGSRRAGGCTAAGMVVSHRSGLPQYRG
jgi:hypothetical protein